MCDAVLATFEIDEDEKDPENPTALGKKLRLCGTTYTDLEEIIARFVEPVASLVDAISRYAKFEDLPDVRRPAGITSRSASMPSCSSSPARIRPICPTESR